MDELKLSNLIKKELQERIPEFERFKFKIKVANEEVRVVGERGMECLVDTENKSVSQIVDKLEPCIREIVNSYK